MVKFNINLDSQQRQNTIRSLKYYSKNISSSFLLPKLSRLINKYLYNFGFGSAINRYQNSFTIYSSSEDKKLYRNYSKDDKFLNFGSGAFFHKFWTNYDYQGQSKYYQNLQGTEGQDFFSINLCNENLKIPEKNNSISLIYCSHTLEHLDDQSSYFFLKECFRILKKNGVLRLNLPNTKNHFDLMNLLLSQRQVNKHIEEKYIRDATWKILSDTSKINIKEITKLLKESKYKSSDFYKRAKKKYSHSTIFDGNNPERHINYWDFEKLIYISSIIGFGFVIPTYQCTSVALPFKNNHIFDNTESHASFYADIVK